jgi:hypothetical protein
MYLAWIYFGSRTWTTIGCPDVAPRNLPFFLV